ncbi:MAG: acetyl-CoA C-acetyltransferase [Gammaproteobacteria bacterium]|nr:acetyl-CoA C-acetyltransferase [Gammaproteobacteria bacterium]MDH3536517.1 acetyl-CoA C-acetyltransferase [Gammaproteobacteria bacterium]
MAATNKKYAKAVYLVDGSRTPFLKARGRPGPFRHAELGVYAARAVLLRMPFEPTEIDEVIFGATMPGPDEANISRIVALRLGCGDRVPAYTVQRNCASGMQALDNAAMSIACGRSDLVLAGGIEAMSHAPLLFHPKMVNWLADWWAAKSIGARLGVASSFSPRLLTPVIALLKGLTDPVVGLNMGQTAEQIAWRFGITRGEMDQFALQSHQKLHQAQQNGELGNEVVPVYDSKGKVYELDDGVRPDSTLEKLGKLRPAFDKPYGLVTPGNSAQITDGAAALVLASESAVKKHDLPVLARLVSTQWAALTPAEMGLGPAHAIAPLLKSQRLKIDDIDYWEINEAFAAQVLAVIAALKDKDYCKQQLGMRSAVGEIPADRLNIHGGGVSLGHPVGTSGARIVLHLARVLQQKNAKSGIASLCIGGGQGGAMLIERSES